MLPVEAVLFHLTWPAIPMAPVYAPLDGTLKSLPDFVDFNATHNARLPWFSFPAAHSDESGSISSISYEEMARATHLVAHWIRPGVQGLDHEVVMLFIHTDVPLYVATILGIMRAGWAVRPTPFHKDSLVTLTPAISRLPTNLCRGSQ